MLFYWHIAYRNVFFSFFFCCVLFGNNKSKIVPQRVHKIPPWLSQKNRSKVLYCHRNQIINLLSENIMKSYSFHCDALIRKCVTIYGRIRLLGYVTMYGREPNHLGYGNSLHANIFFYISLCITR